ncbi:hypothetical protein EST38_g2144 [Candolleomyces aberdarensis]|uniref:Uncharacterized protein n=1 Tax=Candolleomyces aberdarensis TaxID=2316362 RepID=A0A4V1Q4Y5_9AGAR|nr:hypothetical protein EST38_g2144 [Candolleomyces aberdarensis]
MSRPKPLARLFSTNIAPNAAEITNVQQGVDALTEKIVRLKAQLEILEEDLRKHQAILSFVRRIPAEVLGEIFKSMLPSVLNEEGRKQLVNLCLVCKPWCHAARLTHRLWSGLEIETEKEISYVKAVSWFRRSGVPRTLKINTGLGDVCAVEEVTDCDLDRTELAQLLTEGPSLDTLSLRCSSSRCFEKLVGGLESRPKPPNPRPWDSIRSLTLDLEEEWKDASAPESGILTHIPVSVTSFRLLLPSVSQAEFRESDLLHIPPNFFERLISFTIGCDWEQTTILSVLRHCTNVETLTIDFYGSNISHPDDSDPLAGHILSGGLLLPNVRTLRLQRMPSSSTIFQYIKTPSLINFNLNFGGIWLNEIRFADRLKSFVKEQSSCEGSLRSISLQNVGFKSRQLESILRNLPFVTHVTLDNLYLEPGGNNIFFTLGQGAAEFLPNLEVLELLEMSPEDAPLKDLGFLPGFRRGYEDDDGDIVPQGVDKLRHLTITYRPVRAPKEHSPLAFKHAQDLHRIYGISTKIGPLQYIYTHPEDEEEDDD